MQRNENLCPDIGICNDIGACQGTCQVEDVTVPKERYTYHNSEYTRWDDVGPVARLLRTEDAVKRILTHIDPEGPHEGTDDTPQRVAKMWVTELCAGYHKDPKDVLKMFDSTGYKGMVIQKDIPVVSSCEHHMVPFIGRAYIGYFPNGKVVGLSKFKRLVDVYARRLQIQERLTHQIADALHEHLEPRGVMVVIEAEHLCMTIRGVQAPGTKTITSAVTGLFNDNREGEKEEFLRLIGR